jgi:hypothetical protein
MRHFPDSELMRSRYLNFSAVRRGLGLRAQCPGQSEFTSDLPVKPSSGCSEAALRTALRFFCTLGFGGLHHLEYVASSQSIISAVVSSHSNLNSKSESQT